MNTERTRDEDSTPAAKPANEERYNRIAEAAYLRAAARGFAGGDPLKDWLDAEAELMKSADQTDEQAERSTQQEQKR
jgi:hypothetical protein